MHLKLSFNNISLIILKYKIFVIQRLSVKYRITSPKIDNATSLFGMIHSKVHNISLISYVISTSVIFLAVAVSVVCILRWTVKSGRLERMTRGTHYQSNY